MKPLVLVHGGAGHVPEARRAAHDEGCRKAADAGLAVLLGGGTPLDAVVAAVQALEDDPAFNAGHGASLTEEGSIELDASAMEGATLRGGGVCALPAFKNPVRVARAVLDDGRHVLYAGAGAEHFALGAGFERLDDAILTTEGARAELKRYRAGEQGEAWAGGTVGAVCVDGSGSLAAATSTGGTMAKRPGRVGDTPILGAGTYADDRAGACSATGAGEAIMRAGSARTAVELIRAGKPAEEAARLTVAELADRFGGTGGVIVVDPGGRIGRAWNTPTMSHAVARQHEPTVSGH